MANYECKVCEYKGKTKEEMRAHIKNEHSKLLKTKSKTINPFIKVAIILLAIPYAFLVMLAFFGLGNPQTTPLQEGLALLISISPIVIIGIGYKLSQKRGQ